MSRIYITYDTESKATEVATLEDTSRYVRVIPRGDVTYLIQRKRIVGYRFKNPETAITFKEIPLYMRFSVMLHCWRHKQGLSARQAAKMFGLNEQEYRERIECCNPELTLKTMELVHRIFQGIPMHLLFSDNAKKNKEVTVAEAFKVLKTAYHQLMKEL